MRLKPGATNQEAVSIQLERDTGYRVFVWTISISPGAEHAAFKYSSAHIPPVREPWSKSFAIGTRLGPQPLVSRRPKETSQIDVAARQCLLNSQPGVCVAFFEMPARGLTFPNPN